MEKSSNMKEEIYKIVKYQTKLAQSVSRDQQDLYRHKMTQHINNLTSYGIRKEEVGNMLRGGSDKVMEMLKVQKEATLAALNELEKSGKTGQDALNVQTAAIKTETEAAVEKHKLVVTSYKDDVGSAAKAMDEVKKKAETLQRATPIGSLDDLTRTLNVLLSQVKDPEQLASELSAAMEPVAAPAAQGTQDGSTAPAAPAAQVPQGDGSAAPAGSAAQVPPEDGSAAQVPPEDGSDAQNGGGRKRRH